MKSNTYNNQRKARRGFSLLELTLVILIIGVLMGVAAVAFGPTLLKGKTTATKATMVTVRRAIETYHGEKNQYPPDLQALVGGHLTDPARDGWDKPFYYAVPGQQGQPFDLISAGEDGDYTTLGDNINIWTMDDEPAQ